MVGVVILWGSAWIYSGPGSKDPETEATMDMEETTGPEDPATTAEEPATIQTNLKEEVTSMAGSSRTKSSFTIAMDSIMSQLGSITRVVDAIMCLQQVHPSVLRN